MQTNFNPSFTCALIPPQGTDRLWDFTERYLNLSEERYQTTPVIAGSHHILTQVKDFKQPWWILALKISTYVGTLFLLPLAALAYRSLRRFVSTFTLMPPAGAPIIPQRISHEESTETRPPGTPPAAQHAADPATLAEIRITVNEWMSTFEKTLEERRRGQLSLEQKFTMLLDPDSSTTPIRDLAAMLESQETARKHLLPIASHIATALKQLAQRGPEDLPHAKIVYKAITIFLRTHMHSEGRQIRVDTVANSHFPVLMMQILGSIPPTDEENNMIPLIWRLTCQLRRQIKIESNKKNCRTTDHLRLTWLHGTKASVLKSAHTLTNDTLLPTGELQRRSIATLTGEVREGSAATGINRNFLSGVRLLHAQRAIKYANTFIFEQKPEEALYERLLHPTHLKTSYEDFLDRGHFSRQVEAVQRIKHLHPERIARDREQWNAVIEQLYTDIETYVFKRKPNEIFHWQDMYYTCKFFSFLSALKRLESIVNSADVPQQSTPEDLELATIPIVLGSRTQFGISPELSIYNAVDDEDDVRKMILGRDIQVVFTPKKHIPRVQQLIESCGLRLAVEDVSLLEQAATADGEHTDYFCDIFRSRKSGIPPLQDSAQGF